MAAVQHSVLEQQVIALAGAAQAARLVDQIARTGSYPPEFLAASVNSLFQFDPPSVDAVFGGLGGVKPGLQALSGMLADNRSGNNREAVRYLFGLLYLERRFAANADMVSVVRARLQHTNFRAEHFTSNMPALCHSIAGIYQDTISTLKFRIRVTGSQQHLDNTQNADLIRALLLAGIRASFLWHQLGGRRWKLLLQRGAMLRAAQNLSRGLGVV